MTELGADLLRLLSLAQVLKKEFGQLVRTGNRNVKGPNVNYVDRVV